MYQNRVNGYKEYLLGLTELADQDSVRAFKAEAPPTVRYLADPRRWNSINKAILFLVVLILVLLGVALFLPSPHHEVFIFLGFVCFFGLACVFVTAVAMGVRADSHSERFQVAFDQHRETIAARTETDLGQFPPNRANSTEVTTDATDIHSGDPTP
jgi:hypothetical protein